MDNKIINEWKIDKSNTSLITKVYKSYEDYIKHQKSKLEKLKSIDDSKFEEYLLDRIKHENIIPIKSVVICLGARTGGEVRVFKHLKHFAIGIDLNPGHNNYDVFPADFHNLPFSNFVADVVFTNTLDHAFDIGCMLLEIKRILTYQGIIIIEVPLGLVTKEPGLYESMWWLDINVIINLFYKLDFKLIYENTFNFPWAGKHLRFMRN